MFKKYFIFLGAVVLLGTGCITKKPTPIPSIHNPPVSVEQSLVALVPQIEEYLNTKLDTPNTRKDEKIFSAFIPYGQTEKNDKLYYYIWAFREEYSFKNKKLARISSVSSPVALTVEKTNGVYARVADHKIPEDGRGYTPSIKKIFPADVIKKMNLNTKEYNQRAALLQKEILTKATTYFKFQLPDSLENIEKEKCTNYSFERYKMDAKDVYTGNTLADWDTMYNSSTYPNYELRKKIYTGYVGSGVNFAGHFVVVSWECGKKCQEHAVVDMLTGRIVKTGITSQYGAEFKLNSLVLVTNPYREILEPEPHGIATRYYVLNDKGAMPALDTVCTYNDKKSSTPPPGTTILEKRYASKNKEECAVMLIRCKDGEQVFVDDIGCGCEVGGA